MTFHTIKQALYHTRKFHRAYGCKGYTYKAARRWTVHGGGFSVGVFDRRGNLLTII